jgi:hypothetical protein
MACSPVSMRPSGYVFLIKINPKINLKSGDLK